jgi:hypothetical protein
VRLLLFAFGEPRLKKKKKKKGIRKVFREGAGEVEEDAVLYFFVAALVFLGLCHHIKVSKNHSKK